MKVVAFIWPHMLAIGTCYMVTMAVFPGMESEVVSCRLLDWMPIILLSVFHATDLAGKLLAGLGHSWSKGELVLWPLARLCLLPLILLCALPRHDPVFQVFAKHLLFVDNLDPTSGRTYPSPPHWNLGHQQWPLWQPTHDPGALLYSPNQPLCPGPTGCL